MNKKIVLISIIIPIFNENKNLINLYSELKKIEEKLKKYNFEIIFINDGSQDNSWEIIKNISQNNENIKAINFSKNFGHQNALLAGYNSAKGEAIISMDGDLQDPPPIILEMIEKWKNGNDIVYARRIKRNDSFLKNNIAKFYYLTHSKITDTNIPKNVGDFRLIDKKVLKEFLKLKEKDKYLRGIFPWLGFKSTFVDFERPKRINGKSGYSFIKMLRLGMDGILSFSMYPLRIGMVIGSIIMFVSFLFFCYIFYDSVFRGVEYPLFKWISVIGFGFMGLQFIFLWIMGEYIGRIYNETRDRPSYIISEKINID